ncbi:hypothetical protein ASD98_01680 [Flavobacterium sp. Root186]|nr:hypothetical protein ASD98_01680 [Flavobacterium sp. Root186]
MVVGFIIFFVMLQKNLGRKFGPSFFSFFSYSNWTEVQPYNINHSFGILFRPKKSQRLEVFCRDGLQSSLITAIINFYVLMLLMQIHIGS